MVERYRVTSDEVQADRKAFYEEFGVSGGKEPEGPGWDSNKILHRWAYMLASQDGPNYDDYSMAGNNKIERYLEKWRPAPAKVLLLGVGTGREVRAARLSGYDATGVTLGKENRAFAKWKLGLELDYVDHCALPYPGKTFDVVAGFQVFEHCHAPYFFLFECCRVLKEGGLLILDWPPFIASADGPLTAHPGKIHNHMGDYDDDNLHHACCWTPAQSRILARRCNFQDIEVFVSGHKAGTRLDKEGDFPEAGLRLLTEDMEEYWSNVSSGDLVLRAVRRADSDMPSYARNLVGN
jgi:SAM-dependent methyltransferase